MEGIISLPGGMFQPYTGVKTSILVFRKETRRDEKQAFTGQSPRTEYVWFYEVQEDGFSLDAKRNPRPGQHNDLWDALVKFKLWITQGAPAAKVNEKNYFQPSFEAQRWRHALLRDTSDQLTPAGEAFSSLPDTGMWDGGVWGIHELFTDLPSTPERAEAQIRSYATAALHDVVVPFFAPFSRQIWDEYNASDGSNRELDATLATMAWEKSRKGPTQDFYRTAREFHRFFEPEDSPSLPLWKELIKESWTAGMATLGKTRPQDSLAFLSVTDLAQAMEGIAREVAKLDGFDVMLRSIPINQQTPLVAAKHWVVPVREWVRNDEWQSADGNLQGSHDESGLVRTQYIEAALANGLYDEKRLLKEGVLEPECIEAREWNLASGQYKPFDFTQLRIDKSVTELIGDLRRTEQQMISSLDRLLSMVEGHE